MKNTWELTELPPRKDIIDCKRVFKNKFKVDGSLETPNPHLIAKGYTRQEGVNIFETFSSVVKVTNVRLVLAL